MKLCNPRLGAQVLKINDDGFFRGDEKAGKIALREIAPEGLNDDVGALNGMPGITKARFPSLDINFGFDFWINTRSE